MWVIRYIRWKYFHKRSPLVSQMIDPIEFPSGYERKQIAYENFMFNFQYNGLKHALIAYLRVMIRPKKYEAWWKIEANKFRNKQGLYE